MYFYFDPDERRRSLGTFSALYEMIWARQLHLPYWYAGFWVPGCEKMAYKTRFRPCEIMDTDGQWRAYVPDAAELAGSPSAVSVP